MSFPKIVRQTPVKHGDEMALTVSTVQIARNYYDTVVFDDTADKRHVGWNIGDYVIDKSNQRSETREDAMDQHREALYTARTETPKAPAEAQSNEAASRSIRPVIEHALTVYYDGNAELARTLIDRLLDENRSQ